MEKNLNTFTFNYILKLPNVPFWKKEKIEKFSYLRFMEYIERMKVLNGIDGSNQTLIQSIMYENLYSKSKWMLLLSFFASLKCIFSKQKSFRQKILLPSTLLISNGLLMTGLYSVRQALFVTYLKNDLLKTENMNEVNDYLVFSKKFSPI